MTRFERQGNSAVEIAIALAVAAVFAVDLATPLGYTEWVFYLVPVALTLKAWRPRLPILVAAATTILMLVGFLLSPAGIVLSAMARVNRVMGLASIWTLAVVAQQSIQLKLLLHERDWIKSGQRDLGLRLQGERSLLALGDAVVRFLCEYLGAPVGVLYVKGEDGQLRRTGRYALAEDGGAREVVARGEGLLGQAVKDERMLGIDDVPEGYLPVTSALGGTSPRHVLVFPTQTAGLTLGAIELGFVHPIGRSDRDLVDSVAEPIAVAIRSAQYRQRLEELLGETRRQAKELQVQQEELRVTNEELEEQSRALRDSQAHLEAQQAELEQTNAQLEQQSQALERQRDQLSRTQAQLIERADELARANRYKSEFLANMSHELRTPLNSALILAKLLSDNKDGNLTPEQVRYAGTIYSAGNDLLALINDILDLSRIEAGRVEVQPEPVAVRQTLEALERTFQPVAAEKGLALETRLEPGAPASITTDPLRLQQILRNLLSNALKFTERGSVVLSVSGPEGARVAFAVRDTGSGIPPEQQEAIFDAFHQADGSAHRRHGGTGLGLTISRELARCLGGDLVVESAPGQGSTFTLALPLAIRAEQAQPGGPSAPASARRRPEVAPAAPLPRPARPAAAGGLPAGAVEDDRDRLRPGERTVLVIEDDRAFARILRDLAHELRFRCVVATSASEGMQLAERFPLSAVLLDIELPDSSGLGVLERLKHDGRTRHIPVHVISVTDHTREALEMGAVGYAVKPVRREQLVQAFEKLEQRLEQSVRRVLVVEDVAAQRESLVALLGAQNVEIVSVETGRAALEQLRASTFDCMVLDLSLPDMSGYDLLDTMAQQEAFSFPPVIVYTGRSLAPEEELRLRRYASSIIVKGVRSPERLLDEVTLFLHQVEASLPLQQQRMLREVRNREAALEGKTILVVEDDVRNVFALTSVLEPKGAKVRIARNGKEALEALAPAARDDRVDLVLMDVMMPEMDGLAATREIRKRPELRQLPIIALTAKTMPDDREKCLEAGANDYIAKPLDVEKLLSLVKVWLAK